MAWPTMCPRLAPLVAHVSAKYVEVSHAVVFHVVVLDLDLVSMRHGLRARSIVVQRVNCARQSIDVARLDQQSIVSVLDQIDLAALVRRDHGEPGVPSERIHFVGNVMVDTLLRYRERARSLQVPERFGVMPKEFALVTLHRPANVDSGEALAGILEGICQIAKIMPVLFPMHPRTKARIDSLGLQDHLGETRILEPLGYLEFLGLMNDAAVVLTDSGGIQEETTVLGVPCLTLRPNTERPVTVEQGSNTLVRPDPGAIVTAVERAVDGSAAGNRGPQQIPELWDGKAAVRIARIINDRRWGSIRSPG